jgi:hypothetical protein
VQVDDVEPVVQVLAELPWAIKLGQLFVSPR